VLVGFDLSKIYTREQDLGGNVTPQVGRGLIH
jgi:hypothetical protein